MSKERTGKRSLRVSGFHRNIENNTNINLIDIDAVFFLDYKPICVAEFKECSRSFYETKKIRFSRLQQKFLFSLSKKMDIPAYFVQVDDPDTWIDHKKYTTTDIKPFKTLINPEFRVYRIEGLDENNLKFLDEFDKEDWIAFLQAHKYGKDFY